MTTALTEAERIFRNRMERFLDLRFSVTQAEILADALYVDWHYAAYLIERGCEPHLAFEILR